MCHHVVTFAKEAVKDDPDVIVLENVRDLSFAQHRNVLEEAVKTMRESGYWVSLHKICMSKWGVPSTRERCLVIGTKNKPEGDALPKQSRKRISAGEALQRWPIPEFGEKLDRDKKAYKAAMEIFNDPSLMKNQPRAFNYRCIDLTKPAPCILTAFQNPTSMCCLIKRGDDIHKLGLEEAMRLLTIPITRVFCGTKAHRMHQIGSCIPPLFAKKLFRHIREHYLKYARAPEASASAAQARATGAHPTHQN